MMMWKYNSKLKNDLSKYVQLHLQHNEIVDFMTRDYPHYKWSLCSLDRRLSHFEIRYIDENVLVEAAREAVVQELDSPVKLLGYQVMTQTLPKVQSKGPSA